MRPRSSECRGTRASGAKPPLRPKHVWSIRTKLQIEGRARDLAMFNLAIDSKLRGCDVVAIKVEDVAASGYTADRATVRQKKTGRPVRFELSEQTRQAVDDYLKAAGKRPGEFLFTGVRCMTTRQYARLVSEWIGSVGLDPEAVWHAFTTTHKSYPDLSPDIGVVAPICFATFIIQMLARPNSSFSGLDRQDTADRLN